MKIKVRAWDIESNLMVYSDHRTRKLYDVYYGFEMNGQGELECRWEGEFTESHVLDGGTLDNIEQYTGLKDKNGVEIYEGDILLEKDATIWEKFTKPDGSEWTKMSKNKKDEYYAVYFDNKKAQFTANKHWLWSISKSTEVIGNIHENPELLHFDEIKEI